MFRQAAPAAPPPPVQTPDDDLDDLLEESLEAEAEAEPASETEADLDDLLAESVALRDDAKAAAEARDRLRKRHAGSGRSAAEIAADEARVREWELRNDWEATANVALFERYKCQCGRQQTIFRQIMQRQVHRQYQATERWQVVETTDPDLPSEIMVQKWTTGMCTNCASDHGFDFQTLPVGEWSA